MEKTETSLWFYFKNKRLYEKLLSLSLSTGTVFCFLAGIVWVYSMKTSGDPYFILAPGMPWSTMTLEQQSKGRTSEDYVRTNITGQERLNVTVETPTPPHHHEADDAVESWFIRQTRIRGRNAVEKFRARVDCLSNAGQWTYDPTPRKLPWLAVKNYNWVHKCDREHAKRRGSVWGERANSIALSNDSDGTWSVREELKWVWRTNDSSCPWRPMDRNEFCRQIGSKRNVLVVGDSISHEISVAIQNALAMNESSAIIEQRYPGEELCSDILGGVGKGFEVHFVRNDYISAVVNSTKSGRTFQDPWMPQLDNGEGSIKVLIINRGAHYQEDRRFVTGLRNTFETLRDRHPELLVIYRNTPSGHVNCSYFHEPIAMPVKGAPASFHWEDFDRQNMLAKKLVEEFHYIYVDVARPIGMRPEGHMNGHDCLHYCQPGPLDLAVEMIYNILLVLSEQLN